MKKQKFLNPLFLFFAAFIWGTAFAAQSAGMEYIGPFTFSALRSFIGSIFLLPFIWIFKKKDNAKSKISDNIKGGFVCGLALCAAANLQQTAPLYASVGKSGFLTALYIIIVPVIGVFLGKKLNAKLCIASLCALAGLYLLCIKTNQMKLEFGDILLLLCAVAFSIHILAIDHYTQKVNGITLSCIQFFVCGAISAFLMFAFETPSLPAIADARLPLLYVGIFSSGIAYTFQIIGQKGLNPVVASLIMSLESVISAIAGWVILGQTLSGREIAGCAVMFLAILIAQI